MKTLRFYNVDDEYIKYLYQFDNKVPYNKNSKRPYVGIVLEVEGVSYFAPMCSPKKQHERYKANMTFIRVEKDLGIIKLNNMIPVNLESLNYIDFKKISDQKYRILLEQQNEFIKMNSDKISDMAKKYTRW